MEGGSWESEAITEHELRTAQSRGGGSTETGGRRERVLHLRWPEVCSQKRWLFSFLPSDSDAVTKVQHVHVLEGCADPSGFVSICLNIARSSVAQQIRCQNQKSARETMLHNSGICRENTTPCFNDCLQSMCLCRFNVLSHALLLAYAYYSMTVCLWILRAQLCVC